MFKYLVKFLYLFAAVTFPANAKSNTVNPQIPEFVEYQDYNPQALADTPAGGAPYLLISRQTKYSKNSVSNYRRYVQKATSIEEVEDIANVSIKFDESFQKVIWHHIKVIRNNEIIDALEIDNISIHKTETEAETLIYDGSKTATFLVRDVRIGDILDYAYTIQGRNPAFKDHIGFYTQLEWGLPVGKHYTSLTVPNDRPYFGNASEEEWEPSITETKDNLTFNWRTIDQAKKETEADRPSWHHGYSYFELTDMKTWSELGALYSEYYQFDVNKDFLKAEIEEIKKNNPDKKSRTKAALKLAQEEIRYLGLEMGVNGYKPRHPELVWHNRYGDCKDKTAFLIQLLSLMDINAIPVLVNTTYKSHIFDMSPQTGSFDHVITMVKIEDENYFLDPTRLPQMGTLDSLEKEPYGKGLTINGNNSKIVSIAPLSDDFFGVSVQETFDIHSQENQSSLRVETQYRGNQADSTLRDINRDGINSIQNNYLNFYRDLFGALKIETPMQYSVDKENALITLKEHYSIENLWTTTEDETDKKFEAYPYEINDWLKYPKVQNRTSPYALNDIANIKHTQNMIIGSDWNINLSNEIIDNDSFHYSRNETYGKNTNFDREVFSQEYIVIGKKDYIDSEQFETIQKDLALIDDTLGINLTKNRSARTDDIVSTLVTLIMAFIMLAVLMIFIVPFGILAKKHDEAMLANTTFYPVTVTKFLLMNIYTFGIYSVYWTWMNWVWVKTHKDETILPIPRTIFSLLTNFSLFRKIAEHDAHNTLSKATSTVIATCILLGVIASSIIDYHFENTPLWLDFVFVSTCVFYVPLLRSILHVNKGQTKAVAHNSKYTWHSYIGIFSGLSFMILLSYSYNTL